MKLEKFKAKVGKLFQNIWFVISLATMVLLVIDNRNEIKECVHKLLKKESYAKFKDDVKDIFSSYTSKVKRVYNKAIEIIEE